jgi:hypothetical protein
MGDHQVCSGKRKCQRPKELVGKPEKCSPEQIRRCHGEVKKHPCTGKAARK